MYVLAVALHLLTSATAVQSVRLPEVAPSERTPKPGLVARHIEAGLAFHTSLQVDDGHFAGDYGGPMFLLPGLVIACYVTGTMNTVLSPQHKAEMIRYLRNHQNADGGYGLHIEGHSTMFGTGLRCAMRPHPRLLPPRPLPANVAHAEQPAAVQRGA